MAVNQTGAIYKAMTIDGESSRTYGVYITGQAVYNAPQREVEMISIPGRNGQLALDKGRFENIEVTYPAGIYADTEADFAEAVSNFRNYLCSRDGYVRIEDEYNPNEYRMGVYKSGLEVTPAMLKAGEFEITFDCKPQRWLKSGETAVTVDSGDVISNPTLFESSPMLEVDGYGTIGFNGYEIELENAMMGNVLLMPSTSDTNTGVRTWRGPNFINTGSYNTTDEITWANTSVIVDVYVGSNCSINYVILATGDAHTATEQKVSDTHYKVTITVPYSVAPDPTSVASLSYGRNYSTLITVNYKKNGSTYSGQFHAAFTMSWARNYSTDPWLRGAIETDAFDNTSSDITPEWGSLFIGEITVDSTLSILGHPTYIDCDLGEAYLINEGETVSLNAYIDLGSDLPKLSTGANTITFDNTITELKVIPRWWKV